MTIKNMLAKELGSLLSKAASTGVVGSLFGSHRPDEPSSSATSAAWREIEHKLQGLFSHMDDPGRRASEMRRRRIGMAILGAFLVLAIAFLIGRRSGRHGTSVLEVRRA